MDRTGRILNIPLGKIKHAIGSLRGPFVITSSEGLGCVVDSLADREIEWRWLAKGWNGGRKRVVYGDNVSADASVATKVSESRWFVVRTQARYKRSKHERPVSQGDSGIVTKPRPRSRFLLDAVNLSISSRNALLTRSNLFFPSSFSTGFFSRLHLASSHHRSIYSRKYTEKLNGNPKKTRSRWELL